MAQPTVRRATYQDVLDAPEHKVAEIIDGELYLFSRPAPPHASVATVLASEIGLPFGRGRGGPGGWLLLVEPELHLKDDILVPDAAGWRRERLPVVPEGAFITIAPDWLCEVLSPSTEMIDRKKKLPIYARAGVRHVWLFSARTRSLEVLRLQDGALRELAVHRDDERIRVEPFEALELDLATFWADLPTVWGPGGRACEPTALYDDRPWPL